VPIEAKGDRDASHVLRHACDVERDRGGERVGWHRPCVVRQSGERDQRSDKELTEDAKHHATNFVSRPTLIRGRPNQKPMPRERSIVKFGQSLPNV
jgi:hypothetical protein